MTRPTTVEVPSNVTPLNQTKTANVPTCAILDKSLSDKTFRLLAWYHARMGWRKDSETYRVVLSEWCSDARIRREIGLSAATIKRARRTLADLDYIELRGGSRRSKPDVIVHIAPDPKKHAEGNQKILSRKRGSRKEKSEWVTSEPLEWVTSEPLSGSPVSHSYKEDNTPSYDTPEEEESQETSESRSPKPEIPDEVHAVDLQTDAEGILPPPRPPDETASSSGQNQGTPPERDGDELERSFASENTDTTTGSQLNEQDPVGQIPLGAICGVILEKTRAPKTANWPGYWWPRLEQTREGWSAMKEMTTWGDFVRAVEVCAVRPGVGGPIVLFNAISDALEKIALEKETASKRELTPEEQQHLQNVAAQSNMTVAELREEWGI